MTLVDVIQDRSELPHHGIMLIKSSHEQDFLSYHALYRSALRVLDCLQSRGLCPGRELVLQIGDNQDFLTVFWACILGGIIPVPLSVGKNEDQWDKLFAVWSLLKAPALVISRGDLEKLERYSKRRGAGDREDRSGPEIMGNVLFSEEAFLHEGEGDIHPAHEQDIAFIQFSSGSTGNPKGVVLTHANLIANMIGIAKAASYTGTDRLLSWMPLTHDMGMIGFHLNPLYCGINQYIMPTSLFVRNPASWLDMLSEHRITVTCAPNFGYRYLLKHIKDTGKHWDLSCIRIIYNGAEPISENICREFNQRLAEYGLRERAICPVYGLAEASVAVTISDPADKIRSLALDRGKLSPGDRIGEVEFPHTGSLFVNVGKPVDQCSVSIAGSNQEPLEENIIGYVRIRGMNVSAGYYNDPAASRESIDDKGWLNTGDLGFIREGDLYITGRMKDVIFVNGQNYYAHDIEKEAGFVEGIELNKIAVSGFFNAVSQSEEIIAFLHNRGELTGLIPTARSLKAFVNEKFGFALNRIIPVKVIPKTTSGKLQRFQLVKQYINGDFRDVEREFSELLDSYNEREIVPPMGELEERLLRIWEAVLGDTGVEGKFVHAGGDSLKGAELVMKIQQEFQVELPMGTLYTLQTVRELAKEIGNLSPRAYLPIPAAKPADTYPLPALQRRIYYAWKINPASIAYNMPGAVKLSGRMDKAKLEQCLRSLVLRHDALRMVFPPADEPVFKVSGDADVRLCCMDCIKSGWDEKLRQLVLPFDLAMGPLFRFFLLADPKAGESVLLLDIHHIISDGLSAYRFVHELMQLYYGNALPAAVVSFRDYAVWEWGRQEETEAEEGTKRYWADQLSGELPVLELPYDFARPAIPDMAGKRKFFRLSRNVSEGLRKIAMNEGVSIHALFFTLYNILLAKYSGQEDIITGIPVQMRDHPDLQNMQGMFVNTLPVRCRINGSDLFSGMLRDIAVLIHEAIDHRGLAFDGLLNLLDLPHNPGRSPLFDTMFLYQETALHVPAGELAVKCYPFDPGFSKFDITLEVLEDAGHFRYAFEYSTALFKEETIRELAKGFELIIKIVIGNPAISIAAISPLSEEEMELINSYNSTDLEIAPFHTVQQLFEKQAERTPGNIALDFNIALDYKGNELTYAELDSKANQVAGALKAKGIKKGDLVGVQLKRSPELIMIILGILKAGAAYLPLETNMPHERIQFILQDSACKILISDQQMPELTCNTDPDYVPIVNSREDLAYVIYTSGTTGLPKGVMIGHGSLTNYIMWASRMYIDVEPCSFAFYSSISFDLTVTSLFTPLITGNKIVIYGEDDAAITIENVVRDNKADVIKLTPSHLKILTENQLLSPGSKVRRFIVGGEALDMQLARDVYILKEGKIDIFNEYGPTEATVGCMIYRFSPEDTGKTVPIGRPIDNMQIYILDKNCQHTPVNVHGEIYIGGDGLAEGYLNNPALTEGKFIANPWAGKSPLTAAGSARLYRTGDVGKRLADGNLVYIGRNDSQVKINGNRVELSGIEYQLVLSGMVKEAVVLIDDKKPGHILAYYVPALQEGLPTDLSLRNYLAERLPYYMVPAALIPVASIPLTSNGKIDKAALMRLQGGKPAGKEPAGNEIERLFVKAWLDVLKISAVGIRDSFYELGGDSIKAVQISSRLLEDGIAIRPKDILTYHTIENICSRAERVRGRSLYEQGILEGRFAPTPIQCWFLAQPFVNPHYYNQSVLFKLIVPVDRKVLEQVFTGLIRQHDTLRLNYDREEKVLYYNNGHLQPFIIQEFCVGDDQDLITICENMKDSFDIAESLLIRAAVIRDHGGAAYLFITAHHLVMDGVSWRILVHDFCKGYALLESGKPLHFPPKTASYKNWSVSLHSLLSASPTEQEAAYWLGMDVSEPMLPRDFATKDLSVRNQEKVLVSLEKGDTDSLLRDVHKPYNTDVPILLNAALVLALHQWTGAEEFIIEQESHGRHLEGLDTSGTVGWFTAMYPLRLVYKKQLGELIGSLKESMRKVPAGGLGYGNVFLQGKTNGDRKPAELRFNYLGQIELDGDILSLSRRSTGSETDPRNPFTAALELNAMIVKGRFQMEIAYNSQAFRKDTITRFSEFFIHGLAHILSVLREEHELHFTQSDFMHAELNEEEIRELFSED